MKELVGTCSICNKEIYCENGFFNGVINDDQTILCFTCHEDQPK